MQGTTPALDNVSQSSMQSPLLEAVMHLPILTTVVATVFCLVLFRRYRQRGGLHLLWWAIGMATYGLGTLTESATTLFGWNSDVFKLWYVFGAFLGGYPLAQGSLYLLARKRRLAHLSAIVCTTAIIIGAIAVALSPVTFPGVDARLSGSALNWQWIRAMTPFINIYSAIVLIGGALVSAFRFRTTPDLRGRYLGNILIAIGALLPGIGGTMTRMGHVEVLYVTELLGLLFIFAGYRKCVAAPQPATEPKSAIASVTAVLLLLMSLASPQLLSAQTNDTAPQGEGTQETVDQDPRSDSGDNVYYGTVTVTATGNESDTHQVAQPVTVLKDIDLRLANNAADLLRWEPGVDVDGVGAVQVRPVIRGLRGLRVLFLEDGLRMNNSRRQTDFGEISGLVPNELVDRIEVVRGAASVLYGTDAIGGVVNMITHRPSVGSGWAGNLRVTGGSVDDSTKVTASLAKRSEQSSWSSTFGVRDVSDYEAPAGTFGDIKLLEDTSVLDTGVEDNFFKTIYSRDLNSSHSLILSARGYSGENSGFGLVEPSLLGDDSFRIRILYPEQDFQKFVATHLGTDLGWADTLETKLYSQSNERILVNDIGINIGPIFPGAPNSSVDADTVNNTDMDTWGVRSEAAKAAAGGLWTYGVEAFFDDSFNTDSSVTTTTIRVPFPPFAFVSQSTDNIANAPNATNSSIGAFAQYERLIGDRAHVSLGTRYQQVTTQAEPTPDLDVTGLDFDDSRWVGAATLRYQLQDNLQLVGSLGSSFRMPSIIERLFNGPTPEGAGFQLLNPNLKSETGINYDIGLKYRGRRTFAEVTYFENRLSDGISQHFLSPADVDALAQDLKTEIALLGPNVFVVQQRNIEELTYTGFELAGGINLESGVTVGGNFSLLDADRTDSANPPTGESYGNKTNLFLRYAPASKPYYLEWRIRHSPEDDFPLAPNQALPPAGLRLPSLTVQQLAAGWTFSGEGRLGHQLNLVVDNLSDDLYSESSNASFFRPQPGRGARVSYGLRF